jgi:DNA-binding MarR family transcriptional regulator/GNAT superfamily N-acetyltransferase
VSESYASAGGDGFDATRDVLRRFNRSHTQRIGVLDESFLGSGRPLGPSRLLFEIGPRGAGVIDLRRRLGLDSGYVSRMLRQLEADGLVTVQPDPDDGRRRMAALTPVGIKEWSELDERSDELAGRLIGSLSGRQRDELRQALATADRLLRAATITLTVVDPRSDDAIWAMTRYFDELDRRFPDGFDPGDTLVADAPELAAPHGAFVVAYADDSPVGCGGVQRLGVAIGEVKRMWVHPEWRGVGLGRRLLHRLEDEAVAHGFRSVRLDTNSVLVEAIAMYESAGYRSIEAYNHNPYARCWFEKDLPSTHN